ncbi:Clp protease [Halomonas elongata]|uniref:Clp protease n=1 Tax=Halomonas elongata TaxID=2746 RepID=A0A1B8P092_HALEL|nr:hypothetical protein [Halomonas elongata]OBX35659.1 Clp protease [Halomonas elongata]
MLAIGNRLELREIADWLEPFDAAAVDIYQARTGIAKDTIVAQLDAETWIGGRQAVDAGWADTFLDADEVEEGGAQAAHRTAAKELDLAMAKAGASAQPPPRADARVQVRHAQRCRRWYAERCRDRHAQRCRPRDRRRPRAAYH